MVTLKWHGKKVFRGWYLCGSIPVTFDQCSTFILLELLAALDLSRVLITSVTGNKG